MEAIFLVVSYLVEQQNITSFVEISLSSTAVYSILYDDGHAHYLIGFAGMPTTHVSAGISHVTVAPAPIMARAPILQPGMTEAPV